MSLEGTLETIEFIESTNKYELEVKKGVNCYFFTWFQDEIGTNDRDQWFVSKEFTDKVRDSKTCITRKEAYEEALKLIIECFEELELNVSDKVVPFFGDYKGNKGIYQGTNQLGIHIIKYDNDQYGLYSDRKHFFKLPS